MFLRLRFFPALAFVACALFASLAAADAASGTYTGQVNARGNYYWERSTRVVSPALNASLATPSGIRGDATYLLDAISSASVATGTIDDKAFTERRNEFQGGLGYEFDLGAAQLDLYANGRVSKEPDYHSRRGMFLAALSLDQRNSVIHLMGSYNHDDVYRVVRMLSTVDPTKLVKGKPDFVGDLQNVSLSLWWDQIINRTTTLMLGYDLSLLYGFQANAYRTVRFFDGGVLPEHHPDQRTRNAPYVFVSHFFERTRSSFRIGYRYYFDDWDIQAHAAHVHLYQEVGDYFQLRVHYRYYRQSNAFFAKALTSRNDEYRTADPKMTQFHDQTFGLQMRLNLDFLSFTALNALHTAALDWSVDYILNTNRYGNGVLAQGGLSWSF